MANLLLFNLATDADDPILGFTTVWINRLAAHYERVDVITMRAGRLAVPANVYVHSVGKERGYSEARRAAEFYRLLAGLLAARRYAACFAHMMPLFAAMGAPLLKPRRVPIVLWYTHRQAHRTLQLALAVSDRVVTAAADSFPLRTKKLRVLGHGIDTDFFRPGMAASTNGATPRAYIVQVARLMPIKHQATLIRALAELRGTGHDAGHDAGHPARHEACAVLVGDVPDGQDGDYQRGLQRLAADLNAADCVIFAGSQTPDGVRDWLRRASVAVNLSPAGLFDKAALESMAVGAPTIVSSSAFDPLLRDYTPLLRLGSPDDYLGLAARLRTLLAFNPIQRAALSSALRTRVNAAHSLDTLIPRLVSVLGEP
jgi:glycosyltransferase involved in cell wall biosynthesis